MPEEPLEEEKPKGVFRRLPFWTHPFLFFLTQFVSYSLIIINGRAYNQANYLVTVISDAFFGFYGFYIIKAVGDTKHRWSVVGYVLGGVVGSVAGIWLSKKMLGA